MHIQLTIMALLSHSFQIKAFLNLLFIHFIRKCNKKNRLHIFGNHFTHTIQESVIILKKYRNDINKFNNKIC